MKQSLSITIMLLFVVSLAFPQATPTVMNYQGRLTDNDRQDGSW